MRCATVIGVDPGRVGGVWYLCAVGIGGGSVVLGCVSCRCAFGISGCRVVLVVLARCCAVSCPVILCHVASSSLTLLTRVVDILSYNAFGFRGSSCF